MEWQLWLAFAIGVLARWGERIQEVVAQVAERTWKGYAVENSVRLTIRALFTCYLFYQCLREGWVDNWFMAVAVGVSADQVAESFLKRAKKAGERLFKNGEDGPS